MGGVMILGSVVISRHWENAAKIIRKLFGIVSSGAFGFGLIDSVFDDYLKVKYREKELRSDGLFHRLG